MSRSGSPSWEEILTSRFEAGIQECDAGCGDKAQRLELKGKYKGAWCRECYREVAYGKIKGRL